MRKMLVLGGTGIIGIALASVATTNGYRVHCLGQSQHAELPKGATFVQTDTKSQDLSRVVQQLQEEGEKWDIVVDVIGSNAQDAKITYDSFKGHCDRLFVISTTLVYDRYDCKLSYRPISSQHPLAEKGLQGGYVDNKIEMEQFWQQNKEMAWTILRPYHILGAGSLLGCIPPHNRDPQLVEHIRKEHIIRLADGGRIPLNIVHPHDLGEIILRAAQKENTIHKCYNAVNPQEIIARDYYEEIARQLGKSLRVHSETSERVAWHFSQEWQLTTLPHLYDVTDLKEDIGYVPSKSLSDCIKDALQNHLSEQLEKRQTEVHRRMNVKPAPKIHPYYYDAYYGALYHD